MQAKNTGLNDRLSIVAWPYEVELLVSGLELCRERSFPPEDDEDTKTVRLIDHMLHNLRKARDE